MENVKRKAMPVSLLRTGAIGLAIGLAVNLLGIFVFEKPAARFGSDGWWSQWFPAYLCWLVFLLIGFVRWSTNRLRD